MHKRTTPKIFGHAKQLHRNMTRAEVKLWTRLRAHRLNDIHFRNQHAIGNYVVDFCAPRKKLIIELDGSQHLEQDASQYDEERTKYFESQGYRVIRFGNNDVMNDIEGVIRAIIFGMESELHSQEGDLNHG
jgi:very-short-patch-repair endonuclease